MTTIDVPANFPFTLMSGRAKVRTSLNEVLNGLGTSLPKCANIEVIDVSVYAANGDRFASTGVLLPPQ